ncbi:MAG: alpha/beta fold hydrolase, partial [Synechococcales bacterium]|nr:alpha/beta fold hydrolase [Synechococcales bacterium]
LHSLGGNRQDLLDFALQFQTQGFNVVLVDLREHGEIGGEFFTYGDRERADMTAVIDDWAGQNLPIDRLAILGVSAGGTVAIAAASHDARIDAVITIGTFADLRATIEQQVWYIPGFWRDRLLAQAERIGSFQVDQASPRQFLRSVKVPTLIIHGKRDTYIPFSNAEQLYEAAPASKQWYVLENANHDNMLWQEGPQLRQRIIDFLNQL